MSLLADISDIVPTKCNDGSYRGHIDTQEKLIRVIRNKFEWLEYKPKELHKRITLSDYKINISFESGLPSLCDILDHLNSTEKQDLFEKSDFEGTTSYVIKKSVTYINCEICTGSFKNVTFLEDVSFHDSYFQKNAWFYKCQFNKKITFANVRFEKGLDFEKNVFKGDVVFSNSEIKGYDVDFRKCIFEEEFKAHGLKLSTHDINIKPNIDFSESIFHKDVDLSHITFDRACSFAKTKIYGNFLFQKSHFLVSVDFFFADIRKSILFSPSPTDNDIEVIPNTINKISFNRSKICNRIDFENCEIDTLEACFANIQKDALFRIYESKIRYLDLRSVRNNGIIILENNQNLIDEITLKSTINTGLIEIENTDAKTILDRKTARLLKDSALKSGNKIDGLHYKAKEMTLYQKELFASFRWNKIRSFLNETILLILNTISNNNGLSWSRGLLFTFLAWVSFYALFIMSRDGIGDVFFLSIETNREGFINYLWLPNGLKDLLNDDKTTSWLSSSIFIFGKIAIAYGIYQTITAFRKYKN